jgi:hypothetical protein
MIRGYAGRVAVILYPGPLPTSLVRSGFCDSEQSREREEKFLSTRGLPLQDVARLVLDRLLNNPSRIVIGLDYRVLDLLVRLSPGLVGRAMGLGARWAGF